MGATANVSSTDIRYAPEDPSLPKPWKALVDGNTGYVYFWNPETDVTQYERPVAPSTASSVPANKSLSSSVQKFSNGCSNSNDDDKYNKVSNGGLMKNAYASGSYENVRSRLDIDSSLKMSAGYGSYAGTDGRLSAECYRQQHEITVTGNQVPQPFTTFQATGFPSEILREVQLAGFSVPTPIQAQSWPIALQGRDIVAIAKTGSGKTLGYMIPGFIHLRKLRNNPKFGPTVLVLSPTRELATQIHAEAVKFGRSSKIACTCLYGGAQKGPQLRDLDRGMDVVVATPGRLNDILEMRKVSLHQVSYLVLDEADRMLDMGFEPQIRKIVKEVPSRRQTLMYTATWPKEVRRIAADLLTNPVQVSIGSADELAANKAITQHVEVLPQMDKRRRLEQILRSQEPGSKIIVFCSTKKMCDQLASYLTLRFLAAAIHGDKSQAERDHALSHFRSGRTPILVATDVAARGLDIKDIRVVINYDFPTGIEDYVHRIGRTGRAGATGEAYTFFCEQDAKHASGLIKLLERANQHVPIEVRDMASRGGGEKARRPRGSGSKRFDGGHGRRSDSAYGGKNMGRGGWGMPASTGNWGTPACDRERQDRVGPKSYDGSNTAVPEYNNFYKLRIPDSKNGAGSRSRSRSLSRSPNQKLGRGYAPSRSRSRSIERFGGVSSFTSSTQSLRPYNNKQNSPHKDIALREIRSYDDYRHGHPTKSLPSPQT